MRSTRPAPSTLAPASRKSPLPTRASCCSPLARTVRFGPGLSRAAKRTQMSSHGRIDSLHRLARLYRVSTVFEDGFRVLRHAEPRSSSLSATFQERGSLHVSPRGEQCGLVNGQFCFGLHPGLLACGRRFRREFAMGFEESFGIAEHLRHHHALAYR